MLKDYKEIMIFMAAESSNKKTSSIDAEWAKRLDKLSFEDLVSFKVSRFFEQLNGFFPENMHELFISKVEQILLQEVMKRTGNNQLQAAKILGINRNTLRKKLQLFNLT